MVYSATPIRYGMMTCSTCCCFCCLLVIFTHGSVSQKLGSNIVICDESNNSKNSENNTETLGVTHSKEARIAKLYRPQVYHPFIAQIQEHCYEWNPADPIPGHLCTASWIYGANSQLKQLVEEDN